MIPRFRAAGDGVTRGAEALLTLVFIGGCQSLHDTPLVPSATRDLPANARLVKPDGQRLQLESGRITADSVVGTLSGGQRIALPRDSVASIEVSNLSWPRTLGVVYGGLFVLGLLVGEKM